MGIIITKFWKKKPVDEILEELEREINTTKTYNVRTKQRQRRVVRIYNLISVIIYIVGALLLYFYFLQQSFYEIALFILYLICTPFIFILLRKHLIRYYNTQISSSQTKLWELTDEKEKMLDNVMETETYNRAKTLLEKYAPEEIRKDSFLV